MDPSLSTSLADTAFLSAEPIPVFHAQVFHADSTLTEADLFQMANILHSPAGHRGVWFHTGGTTVTPIHHSVPKIARGRSLWFSTRNPRCQRIRILPRGLNEASQWTLEGKGDKQPLAEIVAVTELMWASLLLLHSLRRRASSGSNGICGT